MSVFVNGVAVEMAEASMVADAVSAVPGGQAGRGIAVAVNGTVVPRSSWSQTVLQDSDRIEILTAVAGG